MTPIRGGHCAGQRAGASAERAGLLPLSGARRSCGMRSRFSGDSCCGPSRSTLVCMGGAEQALHSPNDGSRARRRTLDPMRRAFELRFARTAREIASTAEVIAVTAEHLSHDGEQVAEVRAQRLRSRAEAERNEARRLWDLADELEA